MKQTLIEREIDKLTSDKKISNEILDNNKNQFANYILSFGGKQIEDTLNGKIIIEQQKKESWLKKLLLKIAEKL